MQVRGVIFWQQVRGEAPQKFTTSKIDNSRNSDPIAWSPENGENGFGRASVRSLLSHFNKFEV